MYSHASDFINMQICDYIYSIYSLLALVQINESVLAPTFHREQFLSHVYFRTSGVHIRASLASLGK